MAVTSFEAISHAVSPARTHRDPPRVLEFFSVELLNVARENLPCSFSAAVSLSDGHRDGPGARRLNAKLAWYWRFRPSFVETHPPVFSPLSSLFCFLSPGFPRPSRRVVGIFPWEFVGLTVLI